MTFTLIVICVALFFCIRLLMGIGAGCFYNKGKEPHKLLKKYIDNFHYVQTPLWYCVFGSFGILLFIIFNLLHPGHIPICLLSAYLVSAGVSAMAGPFYQGYINVGSGLPFVDPNENSKMELAFGNKSKWIARFWKGKARVYLAFAGLIEVITGLTLIFIYL